MFTPAGFPRPLRPRTTALAVLLGALLLAVVGVACDLGAEANAREQVHAEALKPLWEVWEILHDDFVDRDLLDPDALQRGATQGLLASLPGGNTATAAPLPTDPIGPPRGAPDALQPVWDTWVWIYETHQDGAPRPEPAPLAQAAIRGLLTAVDDIHTTYITPERFRIEARAFEGNYEGIGAQVYKRGNRFILSPMPGSPAKEGGMLPGDILLAVDGETAHEWSVFEAVNRIRGPRNSTVNLEVLHLGSSEPAVLSIKRGVITMESVFWQLIDGRIAYVRLGAFYGNTDDVLETTLKEAVALGSEALILDLRDNPGGFLSSTVKVTGYFLEEGLVTYEVNGKGKRKDHYVEDGGLITQLPMVVLVNQFSSSGSEVLAGALQDHGRATLVGVRTFGKASVSLSKRLSDGSGLYYSIAHWYTPTGRLIKGQGLQPDVVVPSTTGTSGDLQLEKAIQILEGGN